MQNRIALATKVNSDTKSLNQLTEQTLVSFHMSHQYRLKIYYCARFTGTDYKLSNFYIHLH